MTERERGPQEEGSRQETNQEHPGQPDRIQDPPAPSPGDLIQRDDSPSPETGMQGPPGEGEPPPPPPDED